MDVAAFREATQQFLLSYASDGYKEAVRVAALIEDKAQKTAALAGVFLAAGLSFIKPENLVDSSPLGGSWILFCLGSAIVGLIATILICLKVLWVTEQAAPMPLGQVKEIVKGINVLEDAAITADVQLQLRLEIVKRWSRILDTQARTNRTKAVGVMLAQTVLTISISLVALALVIVLFGTLMMRFISLFAR
ncbi:MAG TPA: hypothetical protein VK814_05440 [Acidobacteriaceae bacterium]|nr:hypothetical protein [Acidobacteriaceae bacterium]